MADKQSKELTASNLPFRLGITGSIASGKSTLARMFAQAGVPLFDADQAVHQAYAKDALSELQKRFPQAVESGKINRQKLAQIITDAPELLPTLESIIHPHVRAAYAQFVRDHQALNTPMIVAEIPLLFENEGQYAFDAIGVTFCDEPELRRRALLRDGMSDEKLDLILAKQMPQAEKVQRADILFDTNQPLEKLQAQVQELIKTHGHRPN